MKTTTPNVKPQEIKQSSFNTLRDGVYYTSSPTYSGASSIDRQHFEYNTVMQRVNTYPIMELVSSHKSN